MESSASGDLGAIAPILLMIFLTGFSLIVIWLFGEPQQSNDGPQDEKRSEPSRSYAAAPPPASRKRPGRPMQRFPPEGMLQRWGCLSRRVLRLALMHISKGIAVISFAVLTGAGIVMIWRWIVGK